MSVRLWASVLVSVVACDGEARMLDGGADAHMLDAAAEDALASRPLLVGTWGGYGTEPGQFVEPSSVELDSDGFVIVAGHEDRVQKFTPEGELVAIWGVAGAGDGQFNHPHGLAVDRMRGDLVYVGDQENHRLQVLSREGAFVRQWGDARFQHIHDVGIDPSTGELYVGDYELHILRRFSPTGEVLAELGGPGAGPRQWNGVWGISTDVDGNVYVADTFNRRVQKLARDGTFLAEWGGFTKPTGVFVDARGIVHVCDSLAEAVVLFDRDGGIVGRWELRSILGTRSEPEDIVIDPTGTYAYVAEVAAHRVYRLLLR